MGKTQKITSNSDVLLGCVYVPPENSKYASKDAFDDIENELLSFSRDGQLNALIGDFNARTGKLPDFIIPDDDMNIILGDDSLNNSDFFMIIKNYYQ